MSIARKVSQSAKRIANRRCPVPLRPRLLLHPNIPKPMHGTAPRNVMGTKWWAETRKAALALTDGYCLACGVHYMMAQFLKRLECHEVYAINYGQGKMRYVETVAICHCCHTYIHDGRLMSLVERGEITHGRYAAIIQHGDRVLRDAGLSRKAHNERPKKVAKWGRWRLVVDGVEYPGKYKSLKEWERDH